MSKSSLVIAVTAMWFITIPFVILLFTKVVGWPLDLTLLIFVPFLIIWIPGSYPLSLAGRERSRREPGFTFPPGMIGKLFSLGILTSIPSVCAVLSAVFYGSGKYVVVGVVGGIGCQSVAGAALVLRELIKEIRIESVIQ